MFEQNNVLFFFIFLFLIGIFFIFFIKNNSKSKNKEDNKKPENINEGIQNQENTHKIGPYTIIRELGKGATSKVYLVSKDKNFYAAKVFQHSDKELLERFKREAEILKQIKHINIVQIVDHGEDNNKAYLILEYVNGKTLDEIYPNLAIIQKIDIILAICNALNYLHNKGIIHRDVKPENILVDKDLKTIKLTDLGISRIVYAKPITHDGQILGTPAYMAPELFEGVYTDPKIDIYSLGITMYEIFTGKVPFDGSPSEIIIKHLKENPLLPSLINPNIPTNLEKVIMKSIEKNPERRYKNVLKLIEDLTTIRESLKKQGEK